MKPTEQQEAFLEHILFGRGHSALLARAGCGKSSTIMMAVEAINDSKPNTESLICAYNKAIADEMAVKLKAAKLPWRSAQASTLHSLGYSLLKYQYNCVIDEKKVQQILAAYPDPEDVAKRASIDLLAAKLVAYAKQAGFGYFMELPIRDVNKWVEIGEHYDIFDSEDNEQFMDTCIRRAQRAYIDSGNKTDTIDFNDMLLLPLVYKMNVRFKKDFVFIDEAQDLSPVRQELAKKFVKPSGRVVIVGDDKQAIYGFSGADANAMHNMIKGLRATVLPLSVTWRCAKAIVAKAQELVPDIQAAPSAAEGQVLTVHEMPTDLAATDAILCRNTAPLIKEAYRLLSIGVACKVEGRAIGEGLDKLASRWKVKTIDGLFTRLDKYLEKEEAKHKAKDNEAKFEQIVDQVEALRTIANVCLKKGETMVTDVRKSIATIFQDDAKGVLTLCTYHRSKGREWDRVILLKHTDYCPSKAAKALWQIEQENNLAYVAYTRAKSTLVMYEGSK